jgi:hypothetical protein
MNSHQIEKIISLTLGCSKGRDAFLGVFPIDMLSKINLFIPGKRRVCILNTDPSWKAGTHWYLLSVDARLNDHFATLFDSLHPAKTLRLPEVQKFIKSIPSLSHVTFNRNAVQNNDVDSCALHTIYVASLLIDENLSFEKIMATFDASNSLVNDCQLLANFHSFLLCSNQRQLFKEVAQNLKETRLMCPP